MWRQFNTSWWKLSHCTADAMCECVCVPFAPLSHDSCCTSSGFCFVWSVCGLASHTVNAVFFTIASKPPLLTVWVGTVSLHTCTVLVCCVLPPLAFLLIRTVTSPWLRKSCLLCVFVIQCQHPGLCHSQRTRTCFLMVWNCLELFVSILHTNKTKAKSLLWCCSVLSPVSLRISSMMDNYTPHDIRLLPGFSMSAFIMWQGKK